MAAVTGIILAAGLGSRLGARTADRPKCLVDICGRPILSYQLDQLSELGVDRAIIVTGYRSQQIVDFITARSLPFVVEIVRNGEFDRTGTARSFQIGISNCTGPVVLIEGDVVFDSRIAKKLLGMGVDQSKGVLARYRDGLSGTFAQVSAAGRIERCLHTNVRDPAVEVRDLYKTVNIWTFSASDTSRIRETLPAWSERATAAAPLEWFLDDLLRNGLAVDSLMVDAEPWVEVDDESDLAQAEEVFAVR